MKYRCDLTFFHGIIARLKRRTYILFGVGDAEKKKFFSGPYRIVYLWLSTSNVDAYIRTISTVV